jgi:DDE superfamily endonuclease
MNLWTGRRLLLVRKHQRADDFQEFVRLIHQHYRGWHVALLLDEDSSHTAHGSVALAAQYDIECLWLPKRSPQLNPMDTLWGQAKDIVSANKQYATIEDQVERFVSYLSGLPHGRALDTAGVYSGHYWLQDALCNYFCGPA